MPGRKKNLTQMIDCFYIIPKYIGRLNFTHVYSSSDTKKVFRNSFDSGTNSIFVTAQVMHIFLFFSEKSATVPNLLWPPGADFGL